MSNNDLSSWQEFFIDNDQLLKFLEMNGLTRGEAAIFLMLNNFGCLLDELVPRDDEWKMND